MAVVPQHATETADGSGDAIFMFPDVPQGELWCGTTSVPGAPASALGMVTTGGQLVGSVTGPGSYGPWICDYSQKLAISMTGLVPGEQYQAVWHADDKGAAFSTYPGPITPTVASAVSGTVDIGNFPVIQTVDGAVTANQGSPPWTVAPTLATSAPGGSVTMSGSPILLPANPATQGVTLSAASTNAHPVTINGGFIIGPGQMTPLLPVHNSNLFTATGTSPDVLSFLVT
jgi:hypothetical protein